MKKVIRLFVIISTVTLLFGGCETYSGNAKNPGSSSGSNGNTVSNKSITNSITDTSDNHSSDNNSAKANAEFQAEVMEAGDFLLVTPDQDSWEYDSADKISVNLYECAVTDQEGNIINGEDLKAGDIIKITFDGSIMESYPAQIRASAVQVTGHNILIDAYLAMIDDIWQQDTGLNGDIDTIGVDTTGWIELSKIEKEIILTKLKSAYGAEIVEGTFDELTKKGLIDKEKLFFPKGVLITLSNMSYDKEKKEFKYSIKKWRGGDGAVGADNCTATYTKEQWKIKNGDCWIS